jgi:hypothetical protein
MKKYTLHNRGKIFLSLMVIALITVLLWPTEMSRREDKIDELYYEAVSSNNKIYHKTQREIDSLFNVIDTEYAQESSHRRKIYLLDMRAELQEANSMNGIKLSLLQSDSIRKDLYELTRELDSLEISMNNQE